jgi:hypothetical protein
MATVEGADDGGRGGGRSAMAGGDDATLAAAKLIREVAGELFGSPVADNMALDMGINRRTVQRWLNGQNTVPVPVWRDLALAISARRVTLQRLSLAVAARIDGRA